MPQRVSAHEDIDAKLDRISGRMEARRASVRSQLQTRPELLDMAEACKKTLQGKLKWLRIGDFEQGKEPEPGIPISTREKVIHERRIRRGRR